MKTTFNITLFLFFTFYNLNAQVGIGTITPDASAILDLESTTQGFLPPRMTRLEMLDITSPAEGLVVYLTDKKTLGVFTGTEWMDMNGNVLSIEIGDLYAGGIIFYLDGSGGGKVCAKTSQSSGIKWAKNAYNKTTVPTPGATSTTDGSANTDAIIAQTLAPAANTYAAGLCRLYSAPNDGGLYDWYLPSKDELNLIYINLANPGILSNLSGNHWSSTENAYNSAESQSLSSGNQGIGGKYQDRDVRAVRAF